MKDLTEDTKDPGSCETGLANTRPLFSTSPTRDAPITAAACITEGVLTWMHSDAENFLCQKSIEFNQNSSATLSME